LPILVQHQALADHLVRLLDKLPVMPEHAPSVGQTIVILPDNGPGTTNGQHAAHRSPEPRSPTPIATVELPPRDGG
jgi:hypothetical protein